jgi:hypothetical protein
MAVKQQGLLTGPGTQTCLVHQPVGASYPATLADLAGWLRSTRVTDATA